MTDFRKPASSTASSASDFRWWRRRRAGVGTLVAGERVRRRVHVETYMGWLRKFLWAMVVLLIFRFVRLM